MKMHDAFPSLYLKAADLESGDVNVTIAGCEIEELGKDNDRKPVLSFKGTDKKIVLNKTNWSTIAKVLGTDETDEWVGKRITLFATEVESFGEMTLAIRVRLKAPAPAKVATAQAALSTKQVAEAPETDEIPF